jgi:hypothetical protein
VKLGLAAATVLAALAVVAGCGGDGAETWEGPPRPLPANGNLPVEEFNAYLDDTGEPLTLSRLTIAAAYVLPIVGDAASLSVAQLTESAGGPPPIEVLVRPNDDSVREQRYELAVEDSLEGLQARLRPLGTAVPHGPRPPGLVDRAVPVIRPCAPCGRRRGRRA